MGIKLSRPENLVIHITGDGAFWMVAQDLETAVREDIPIINVVINNFCFGNTRDRQETAHKGRYIGVFYQNPDFAQFAQLLGAYGERVEKASQFAPALERAFQSGRPAVIDVIQDVWDGRPPGSRIPVAK
jgi:acetolactate synthase-1/2/3 large subunit